MNILFDFITLQDSFINGGNVFTKAVLDVLIDKGEKVYGLFDSNKHFPDNIKRIANEYSIQLCPLTDIDSLNVYIKTNDIKSFFIGVYQRYSSIDLKKIACRKIVVIHDVVDLCCLYNNKMYNRESRLFYMKISHDGILKKIFKKYCFDSYYNNRVKKIALGQYKNLINSSDDENLFLVTDSFYSKYSILYFLGNFKNEIKVYYPPLDKNKFESEELPAVFKNKRYFLLLNADRINKNLRLFLQVWDKFCSYTDYQYYAVVVGQIRLKQKNIIVRNYVSREELNTLQKNAFAFVYPSIGEGFGYPPLECMKYGIPVICSNATSLAEVFENGAVFFNPAYPEDLFKAMITLINNYDLYRDKANTKYVEISERQTNDFSGLISDIIK
jgi:glycosyltransferase involved in cell wall biosynthesis